MKKISLLLLCLATILLSWGQGNSPSQVITKIDDWYNLSTDNTRNFVEDYKTQTSILYADTSAEAKRQLKFIQREGDFWLSRIGTNPSNIGNRYEYHYALKNFYVNEICPDGDIANWQSEGPFYAKTTSESYQHSIGLVGDVLMNPDDTNEVIFGSGLSGIWKTKDGGVSWECVTEDLKLPGVGGSFSFAVDPSNSRHILAGSGIHGYGVGILESYDFGSNWFVNISFSDLLNRDVYRIKYDPNNANIIYAATVDNVYKSSNGGLVWFEVLNLNNSVFSHQSQYISDLQVTNTGRVVVATSHKFGNPAQIITSTNGGANWSNMINSGAFEGLNSNENLMVSAISNVKQNKIYLVADFRAYTDVNGVNHPAHSMFYESVDNGATFDTLFSQSGYGFYGNRGDKMYLRVSPLNDVLFFGVPDFFKLDFNGNILFQTNSLAFNNEDESIHADMRGMHMLVESSSGREILVIGNDGGISTFDPANDMFTSLNGYNLPITQFYKMGISQTSKVKIVGGAQDNQSFTYGFQAEDWVNIGAGDGGDCWVSRSGENYFHSDQGGVRSNALNPFYNVASNYINFPVKVNKDENEILVGINTSNHKIKRRSINPLSTSNVFVPGADWLKIIERRYENDDEIWVSEGEPNSENDLMKLASSKDNGTTFVDHTLDSVIIDNDTFQLNQLLAWRIVGAIELEPEVDGDIFVGVSGAYINEPWSNPYDRVKLIMKSDASSIWEDFSQGLPALPVNKILCYNNGNGLMFCGTDVGVYYRDNSMSQWECFMNGMPNAVVRDMEINYCTNKLYIATYGRGIWSSDIPFEFQKEVTSNETWLEDRTMNYDLIVKSGSKLTIDGASINITDGHKIVVEPEAELYLNGCQLTNECGNFWQGIELQGTANMPQSGQYQGRVVMQNNAVIEYAKNGISTIGIDEFGNQDWSKTGGIIKVYSGEFRNCYRGIEFLSYHNIQASGVENINTSSITNAQFVIDEELPNKTNPYVGISLYDVHGVSISNSTFVNNRPDLSDVPLQGRGQGIHSLASSYRVGLSAVSGNTFTGLSNGVSVGGPAGVSNTFIKGNNFYNCGTGVELVGDGYSEVRSNNFDVQIIPQPDGTNYNGIGVVADNANGFLIFDNDFTNNTNSGGSPRGALLKDASAITQGEYYGNRLYDIPVGNQMERNNSTLTVDCNEYNHNSNAVLDIYHAQGTMANQGAPGAAGIPSDNEFIGTCDASLKSQIHREVLFTNTWQIKYENTGDYPLDASCISNGIADLPSSISNGCALHSTGTIPDKPTYISNEQAAVLSVKGEIDLLKEKLNDGDDEGLITAIDNLSGGNLKDELMAKSPYLSDRVLSAYLTKPQQQSNGHIKQIVIANSPVSADVMLDVDALNLPNGIKNQIDAAQIGISPRDQTLKEIEYLNAEKLKHVDAVVRTYLDTLWIDSAKVYLEQEGSIEALCALVPLEFKKDPIKTANHLDLIEQEADAILLEDPVCKKGECMKSFCDFYQALLQANNRPGGYFNMNEQEIAQLRTIIEKDVAVSANAKYLLDFIEQRGTFYILPDLNFGKMGVVQDDNSDVETFVESKIMTLYPNPTSGYLEIQTNVEIEEGIFVITNLMGQRIARINISNGLGNYNISDQDAGIYIVELYEGDELIDQQKIVLQK